MASKTGSSWPGELLFQIGIGCAKAVNVSSCLRCLRTKTGNASSALRPFASQDHLVGTATGPPSRSAQPRIQPINPNRTARRTRALSFNYLVGALLEKPRDVQTQRFRRLEIENQLKPGRLHDWQVGRFRALEDLAGIDAGLPIGLGNAGSVA